MGSVCARRVANGHFFHSKSEGESSGGDGERAEVAQAAASVTPLRALSCARAPPKLEGESSCGDGGRGEDVDSGERNAREGAQLYVLGESIGAD